MSKSVVRSVKNVTKGYSRVEKKVRDATSNDAWGPSGTEMSEIAQMTFNNSTDFYEIMNMLDKRMNDKGKSWRHVLKSLKVLDYCLHEGSEMVVTWARKNVYVVKTLREFQHIDEAGNDVGQNVRVSAKELTSLILDEERLRAERHDRKLWKQRVTGLDDYASQGGYGATSPTADRERQRRQNRRPNRGEDEENDLEYRLAIEASKNQEEEDKRRRESHGGKGGGGGDEDDLARAIKLSKEEEELRRRELEEQNAAALFDDVPAQANLPQITGYNQGYSQQGEVDWSGNLIDVQPQSTGYLNNVYSQPTGMYNPQQTGFQNGSGYNGYAQQPQQTGFNNYQQQQPAQFMNPQQTAFNMNNPYSQMGMANQNQTSQQATLQQPGSNNPWASQSQTMEDLRPQATGSNNPFASSFNRPQTSYTQRIPTLSTLQEQKTATQSQLQPMSFQATERPQTSPNRDQDPHLTNLNNLLATGDGQDTFGNVGNTRIPAQHTAPGTFVNSAGSGANRLMANATGSNPFVHSQFTGMPQQTGFMAPAQTGPVGGYNSGFGSANPFGGAGMQQQQQRQQGGSLIDL